ncbi:MAG: Na+/H+ antiporter NhaC family protein [Planctomycetales bacterium]|nr:Na+/H+ antiporter NhaC family protein [Planctomycetales bacterium]
MPEHPYGLLSLLPPLMAITLAIATRRVVLSLLLGVWSGALLLVAHHPAAYGAAALPWLQVPLASVGSACRDHLWPALTREDKLAVYVFTMLMGAMVGVIRRSGGMLGLVNLVARWARTARRGQVAGWLLGLVVFFDDYANTMLLGGTLRPLFERLRISREKLAYLVDSTAAPVSGLAIVSTWVAAEIDYVHEGLAQLPVDWNAGELFLRSIPYRFYVLLALILVPLIAWMGRDLGPMAEAERRARGHCPDEPQTAAPEDGRRASHWLNAVIPIAVTVAAIVRFMYRSGVAALADADPGDRTLTQIFGNADAYMSLLWGSLIGLGVAAVLAAVQRLLTGEEIRRAATEGAMHMTPALAILWLASALSALTGNREPPKPLPATLGSQPVAAFPADAEFPHQRQRLYTGDYLGSLLESRVPPWLMPTLVFVIASLVAFSTGTSWGTMGILMPLAIGAAYRVLASTGPPEMDHPVMIGSVAGVLAGAIFGDHCSPISDTTVMSSQACGCSHVDHVRTQLPYAMLAGAVSILCGTLPIAFGVSPWLLLPLGVAAMALFLRIFGHAVPD